VDRAIAHYQRLLQRQPRDATIYYLLGSVYAQKARESGDVSFVTLAEQALRRALDLAPQLSQATRHLAYVLYARHAFQEAITYATQAITLDASDAYAYGVLGDAYLEVGQYASAREAYQRMIHLRADLYAYSRLAGLKSVAGDAMGAIADLTHAIQDGQARRQPAESIAWAQWQLGNEYWLLGQLAAAEVQYQAALATMPRYYRALAGLAQIRVAQQRYEDAIALYQQALEIIPLPDYAAALGDVYTQLGHTEEAQRQYALVAYIGRLTALHQALYNREVAVFYVDHDMQLAAALELARNELAVRHDIYAYDLLAWALYKHDRPQEALTAMQHALKLGTQDARLFFHAGMIYQRLGDLTQARTYLQRALATNPHFHLFHAEVARRALAALPTPLGPTVSQELAYD
jgi:tetratricopeptide (TPR) repeat protein